MTLELLRARYSEDFGAELPEGAACETLVSMGGGAWMFGTPEAKEAGPVLIQGDVARLETLPVGYQVVGIWGHGINSYAFYFTRIDAWGRVHFRLPYGGVYMDNEKAGADIREFMAQWFAFEPVLRAELSSLLAIDSMHAAHYRLRHKDGRELDLKESLCGRARFEQRWSPWVFE